MWIKEPQMYPHMTCTQNSKIWLFVQFHALVTCFMYSLNSGLDASLSATARAAI